MERIQVLRVAQGSIVVEFQITAGSQSRQKELPPAKMKAILVSQIKNRESVLYQGKVTAKVNAQRSLPKLSLGTRYGDSSSGAAAGEEAAMRNKELDHAFNQIDVNHDGVVDRQEWRSQHGEATTLIGAKIEKEKTLKRGLERFGDTLKNLGIDASDVGVVRPEGEMRKAHKNLHHGKTCISSDPLHGPKANVNWIEVENELQQELQESKFNSSVLEAELQRLRKSEKRLQEEVGRESNDLAEARDEMLEMREGHVEGLERLRHEKEEEIILHRQAAQEALLEREKSVLAKSYAENEVTALVESFDQERREHAAQLDTLTEQLRMKHGQYVRAGQTFFVERCRRIVELKMRDRMGSFFSEWKEFALLSRANQAQEELCDMVQTLEQQLVALNMAGAQRLLGAVFLVFLVVT